MTTTMHSAGDDYMYKGIVYLNNACCVLLEHGAYHQAMDTIRDAIFIMKASVSSNQNPKNYVDPSTIDDVQLDERLKQAAQRMAFPRSVAPLSNPPMSSRPTYQNSTSRAFGVAAIALNDYCGLEIDDMMMIDSDEQMLICPVRIECDQDLTDTRNPDLDSAIMLFNLGLAHACLSRCRTDISMQEQLQDAALHIFRLADSILVQQGCVHDECQLTLSACHNAKRFAYIHMAVLHSLLQVRMAQQQQKCVHDDDEEMFLDADCEEVLDRLYYIQNSVFLNERLVPMLQQECFPAAAA